MQRLWKITDPLGRIVTRTYDDANRLSTLKDPTNTSTSTYTYSDNGLIMSVKDVRNFTTSYSYDGFDRAKRTTYPDSSYEETTSYNAKNQPLIIRTRSGATITFTYDEANRVKTKAPSGQAMVTTSYDLAGRISSISVPTVTGDPSTGTFQYFYDTAGRAIKETYPDGKSVSYEIDSLGNITKTTYPDGSYYVERVYDQLNRLTDIKLNGSASSAIQIQYDALSRRKKIIYENGTTTDFSYELDNDLSSLVHTFIGSSVSFSYNYDNAGQITSQQISDGANYSWHPSGSGTNTYGTANNLNEYPTVGGTSHTHSTDGCLTNDGIYKYEFNTERMLKRVRNASTNAIISEYFYDPILRQRQKAVGSAKTNYYYAGWQRLADYDGVTATLQARYVYGTKLDEILIQISASGVKTYYHANNQGSVIATTGSSGVVINQFKYGPFGETTSLPGISHGYTGQRFDAETGLYYYKMRHFSPKTGRFLQPDPAAGAGQMYGYCNNSPLGSTDPMGLASFDVVGYEVKIWLVYDKLGLNDWAYHTKIMIASRFVTTTENADWSVHFIEGLGYPDNPALRDASFEKRKDEALSGRSHLEVHDYWITGPDAVDVMNKYRNNYFEIGHAITTTVRQGESTDVDKLVLPAA